jgi:hypothetical protein
MLIADGINANLEICDIETMADFIHIGCTNADTRIYTEFEISRRKNDLYRFAKWYTSKPCDYMVTFNGNGFDNQVLQYVIENTEKWADLTGEQVAGEIYKFVQRLIDNQNYGIHLPYRDTQFPLNTLDLFKIHHFDNDAKRTSLKWCAFMMNMDVEEMPIHHSKKNLTDAEMDMVIDYERNDRIVTLGLLYLTIGQPDKIPELNGGFAVPELADYKGANKIQQRFDIQKATGMPCLNWSDVKIGEEKNKRDYMAAENIKDERDLMPKKVRHPYGIKFKSFFPKTMSFKTEHVKSFIEKLGNEYVKSIKQEFPITIGSTTYTIAKGGIHSTESNRMIRCQDGWFLRDADVGAQYPNSIIKLGVVPPHLKVTILEQFKETVRMKDVYKQTGKKATDDMEKKKFKSLEGLTKLQMNGGFYGKLGQPGSFLEYPEGVLRVTMGNQIEILMLIEMLEDAGISVVSGNTDGIVSYFPKEKEELYYKLCGEWEVKVGNNVLGKLEYADFKVLYQEGINSYLGIKVDGGVKKKGRFVDSYGLPGSELNKNKSMRIIPMALEAYFVKGISPVDFIPKHTTIFDFCAAKKATGKLHYEEILKPATKRVLKEPYYQEPYIEDVVDRDNEKVRIHKKLIRYFVSKDGNVFKKRGINNEGDPMDNYVEAMDKNYPWLGDPKLKYFNKAFPVKNFKDYQIDYSYYILEALKRIDKIEKTKKAKTYAEQFKPSQQTSLF